MSENGTIDSLKITPLLEFQRLELLEGTKINPALTSDLQIGKQEELSSIESSEHFFKKWSFFLDGLINSLQSVSGKVSNTLRCSMISWFGEMQILSVKKQIGFSSFFIGITNDKVLADCRHEAD